MKKIIRVFPRRTKATPDDEGVRIGVGPGLFDEADEIHISVVFTWDLPLAERLAKEWKFLAPVKIGGPACGTRGEAFKTGMYVKNGYTITSRGCPNKCWFCSVWKREGVGIRELPIQNGWNILDDNLLACSDEHIRKVFAMLAKQPRRNPPEFTGGLEAKILKPWHCVALKEQVRPTQLFFAYDTPDDLEPLREAGKMLHDAGWKRQQDGGRALRCYVLCGWKRDTMDRAEKRMRETMDAGFTPMAMLYRNQKGERDQNWRKWARMWARPAIIHGSFHRNANSSTNPTLFSTIHSQPLP